MPPNPTDIRLAVASQPTLEQSIEALTRAIVSRINLPVTDTGVGSAAALAADFARDPKSWSDAVLANTPLARESASMELPIPVPFEGEAKDAVAAQPSVAQAVTAFLRHAGAAMLDHAEGKSDAAHALATDLTTDGHSWSEAMLSNTIAMPTGTTLAPVPQHLTDVMAMPGVETPQEPEPLPDQAGDPPHEQTKAEARAERAEARRIEAEGPHDNAA